MKAKQLEHMARRFLRCMLITKSKNACMSLEMESKQVKITVRLTDVGRDATLYVGLEDLWDMLKYKLATKRSTSPGIQRRRREALAAIRWTEENYG